MEEFFEVYKYFNQYKLDQLYTKCLDKYNIEVQGNSENLYENILFSLSQSSFREILNLTYLYNVSFKHEIDNLILLDANGYNSYIEEYYTEVAEDIHSFHDLLFAVNVIDKPEGRWFPLIGNSYKNLFEFQTSEEYRKETFTKIRQIFEQEKDLIKYQQNNLEKILKDNIRLNDGYLDYLKGYGLDLLDKEYFILFNSLVKNISYKEKITEEEKSVFMRILDKFLKNYIDFGKQFENVYTFNIINFQIDLIREDFKSLEFYLIDSDNEGIYFDIDNNSVIYSEVYNYLVHNGIEIEVNNCREDYLSPQYLCIPHIGEEGFNLTTLFDGCSSINDTILFDVFTFDTMSPLLEKYNNIFEKEYSND